MDDDRKKPPRKDGPRSAPKSFGAGARPGKPAFGAKPGFAGKPKPHGAKPFVKRKPDGAASAEGERPKRDFKPRDDRPRDAGTSRPAYGDKPFRKGPPRDGEAKPFVRRDQAAADGTDRPKRDFKPREDRPRDVKPFERRSPRDADARPPRRFDKPSGPPGDRSARGAERPRPGPAGAKAASSQPFARREKSEDAPGERIAKRLARVGIASRRDAEELIAAGRVRINGRVLTSPAQNVLPEDTIEVDGTAIPPIERTRLFLFHKPAGVVTTNRDPEGRKTVFDVLPADLPRLMTVGRLDINTEGLLLLTNDGGLSRVLELPATGWLRRYRVRVHGKVDEKMLPALKDGIAVDGVFYGAIEATLDREQGSNAWMTIGLREGKNREVKNILGALGLEVSRLIRISYGPFQLNELPEGHVQEVKGRMLRDQLGDRLVEESGANFEAPVVNPFSNDPVKRAPEPREELAERPKIVRDGERGRIGEGGLIKRRQHREGSRDEALGKMSTSRPERPKFDKSDRPAFDKSARPERGPKPDRAGKRGEREQKPIEPPGGRKANVWMAPGARPIGTGRAAAEKAEVEAKRAARKGGGKSFGKPDGARPRSDRPTGQGPRGPRKDGDADRRR